MQQQNQWVRARRKHQSGTQSREGRQSCHPTIISKGIHHWHGCRRDLSACLTGHCREGFRARTSSRGIQTWQCSVESPTTSSCSLQITLTPTNSNFFFFHFSTIFEQCTQGRASICFSSRARKCYLSSVSTNVDWRNHGGRKKNSRRCESQGSTRSG